MKRRPRKLTTSTTTTTVEVSDKMKRPTLISLLFVATIFYFALSAAIATNEHSLSSATSKKPPPVLTSPPQPSKADGGEQVQSADKTTTATGKSAPQKGPQRQSSPARSAGGRKGQQTKTPKGRNESRRAGPRNSSSSSSPPPISPPSGHDPLALAQEQARRMMGYNNTPPLFLTHTRDFFVDVMRYPPGTKLTTMRADDIDGDSLRYSLKPANIHDASSHFAIDPTSGELRLSNQPFVFHPPGAALARPSNKVPPPGNGGEGSDAGAESHDNNDDNDDDQDEGSADDKANATSEHDELLNRNLYFLNVAVEDGWYESVVELQIHVINSSLLALQQATGGGNPVQLTPDGSLRASERIDSLIGRKTKEFYDMLNRVPQTSSSSSSSEIVYPKFVNPSLVPPDIEVQTTQSSQDLSATTSVAMTQQQLEELPVASTANSSPRASLTATNAAQLQQHQQPSEQQQQKGPLSTIIARGPAAPSPMIEFAHDRMGGQQQLAGAESPLSQPMVVSLVVVCSCLMIALVLLMFIIPISVKRLRKHLKHVELQHEHLSQQTSNGSSTVCSSGFSTGGRSMMTRDCHLPASLSQFTLSSDNSSAATRGPSSVCRQSSYDSATTTMFTPTMQLNRALNRVNNGSIVNPAYLQHQYQQAQLLDETVGQHAPLQPNHRQSNYYHQQQQQQQQRSQILLQKELQPTMMGENIYCPIDDNYSTINTESTALDSLNSQSLVADSNGLGERLVWNSNNRGAATASGGSDDDDTHDYFMAQCPQPEMADEHRCLESPDSIRSLVRFLSLPNRHSGCHAGQQQQHQQQKQPGPTVGGDDRNNNKASLLDQMVGELGLASDSANDNNTNSKAQQHIQVASKTIARTYQISRASAATNSSGGGSSNNGPASPNHIWELERHKLIVLAPLDQGQFGMVLKGKLRLDNRDKRELTVAVKTLKNCASKDERAREELLAEIEVMKLVCRHPNVVKILHCCTSDASGADLIGGAPLQPILLVMEFVELGKLQSYLRKSRDCHLFATTAGDSSSGEGGGVAVDQQAMAATSDLYHLTSRDLVKFIYHVAKGMEYISAQCIVHRDLASRNILVSAQRVCKIGDFGMARHMVASSGVYERHSQNTKVPARWMAPEVFLANRYTTKSDVFSFGILMWEIVTLGSTPYGHLEMEQVIERVARRGERPDKPEYCHAQLYDIMSRCWLHEPDQRPTFRRLVHELDQLLLSANNYIELDQYPDHNYYNIPTTAAPYELL